MAQRFIRIAAVALALVVAVTVPTLSTSGTAVGVRHTVLRASSSPRLSVLVYHAIADLGHDDLLARYSVAPERFAEQVDFLSERGWTFVDLDTVVAAFGDEAQLPNRSVLITFDDAYDDLRDNALPILVERDIPAVAFAVAEEIGGTNRWDCENGATALPLLDCDGLREVSQRGVEIGAHSATHRSLTDLSPEELDGELGGAARTLEEAGLSRPRAFAYPFGHWNEEVAQAVGAAGYDLAFTVDRGVVENGVDPLALPRTAVHADDSGASLHVKLLAATWPAPVRSVLKALRRLRAWA